MAVDVVRAALGVSTALLSVLLSSVGFVLQRKVFLHETSKLKPPMSRPNSVKIIALGIYIAASAPDVVSYALIPQIVVTSVYSIGLPLMIFLGRWWLKEKRGGRYEALGMVACFLGSFITAFFGPYYAKHNGSPLKLMYPPKVVIYLVSGQVFMMVLVVCDHLHAFRSFHSFRVRRFTLPCVVALSYKLQKVYQTELSYTTLPKVLDDWGSLLGIIWLTLLNLYLTVRMARLLPVRSSTSIAFASTTTVQLFQSIFVLEEFDEVSALHTALTLVGVLLVCAGAFYLEVDGKEEILVEETLNPPVQIASA